jgi:hypothetical protein
VRLIHGLTLLVTLTPPWIKSSNNCDFGCTTTLRTFLALEKKVGRLPKRWYELCYFDAAGDGAHTRFLLRRSEHFDAGDGNWRPTTVMFWAFLVQKGVFEEVILSR